MKIIDKLGNFLLCALLALPICLALLSTTILMSYSDSAMHFLFG